MKPRLPLPILSVILSSFLLPAPLVYADSGGAINYEDYYPYKADGPSLPSQVSGYSGYLVQDSGGAVYWGNEDLILSDGALFSNNYAGWYGGAIFAKGNVFCSGSVTFSNNSAGYSGGAIYGDDSNDSPITLSGNGSVEFSGNTASSGGAIYGDWYSPITLSGNGSVEFSENVASSTSDYSVHGGAIYGTAITLSNNGSVTFSGNSASSSSSSYDAAHGGAIAGITITLSGNGSVEFSENVASGTSDYGAYGGAIGGEYDSTITLSGNGSVTFSGNSASSSSDDSYAYGGAIRAYGNLSIRNNDSVLFEKNAEVENGTYRLRSIYAGGSGDTISLSAAKGKSIEFRDSVYIASASTVELNADYTDAAGKIHKQSGDIIFTGKHTEQHLKELLAAAGLTRTATEEEILNSRTTEVKSMTNLYGGQLRIEDGAVYSGCGFNAAPSSASTLSLKDASFNHSGYNLTFNSGTTLKLSGANNITGKLCLNSGSNLKLNIESKNSSSPLVSFSSADLTLNGTVNISILPGNNLVDGTYKIFSGISNPSTWTDSNINLIIPETCRSSTSILSWSGNTLTFYYDVLSATWSNASGNRRWDTTSTNWIDNNKGVCYENKAIVTFNSTGADTVSLVGTLTPYSVTVNNGSGYNYTWQGSGKLAGSMKLYKKGAGTLTIKNTNTFTGGASISGGKVVLKAANALGTGAVTMTAGTLDLGGKWTPNNITLKGGGAILNGSGYRGNYTQNGNLQSGSRLNIISGKTANLQKGNVGGTISGAGNTVINGAVTLNGGKITTNKLIISGSGKKLTANASGLVMNKNASDIVLSNSGSLNSAGAITARNITLSNKATLNAKNSASRNITLGGSLKATSSTVNMHGNLTAGNVVLNNATLRDNGSSARAVTVTNSTSLSNNAKLNIKGYLRSKNLTLNKSSLRQHSNNRGVGLTGTLTMNSGSTLTAQGALSAANMKLSGGTINLTSSSFSTIKVSGTLTLSSAIDLNLGCKLTTGRNYTLIRFNKTNLTSRNNLAKLLGLTGSGATLTLRSTGIILKVTNAAAWNRYLSANKTAFNKAASVVNAITPAAEETEVVEIAANTATTVAAEPAYDRSSADMLVQSNWGVVNASRAFTDTLGNRASNSTAFGADKSSAVWLSAMGASSRLSSDGAAAGSDHNLYGAAVGMEQQLTEKSSLGLAIGESYGRVNSFTSARTQQDTLHTALYGQYSAVERSRDAVLLDWSAAYGRTESKWQGTEWEQKSVQLDARATYAHQLNDKTTVSAFAGLQYYASDSATVAKGCESGSIQNLRGEIGVGIGHKATSKTTVYGELSFVGDMVRHNPTAQTEGQRVRGANPGRAGINFSVGGTHELNDRWSVNASYNMELMERANSHSANIGTSYKF